MMSHGRLIHYGFVCWPKGQPKTHTSDLVDVLTVDFPLYLCILNSEKKNQKIVKWKRKESEKISSSVLFVTFLAQS